MEKYFNIKLCLVLLAGLFFNNSIVLSQGIASHPIGSGFKMPNFRLVSKNHYTATPDHFRGQYVFYNFWSSVCPESTLPLSAINAMMQEFIAEGAPVIFCNIALDDDVESWRKSCLYYNLSDDQQWTAQATLNSDLARSLGIDKLPTSFLVSPDGMVLAQNPTHQYLSSYLNSDGNVAATAHTTASQYQSVQYQVLVGYFGSLKFHNNFEHLSHLGSIIVNKTANQASNEVCIGTFSDFGSAQYVLDELKKQHYTDAKILTTDGSNAVTASIVNNNSYVSTPPPASPLRSSSSEVVFSPPTKISGTPPQAAAAPTAASTTTNAGRNYLAPSAEPVATASTPTYYDAAPSQANIIADTNNDDVQPTIVAVKSVNANPPKPIWETGNMSAAPLLGSEPQSEITTASANATPSYIPPYDTVSGNNSGGSANWSSGEYNPASHVTTENPLFSGTNRPPSVQRRIDALERKRNRFQQKSDKLGEKIHQIEREEVMRSVYGK